jgi:uncharacterized protein (TIGR03435 family)
MARQWLPDYPERHPNPKRPIIKPNNRAREGTTSVQHKNNRNAAIALAVLIVALPSIAQNTNLPPSTPTFDVASIKPAKAGDQYTIMVQYGRLTAKGMILNGLIKQAYGVEDDQILGAPRWVNSQRFDIDAKVDSADEASLKNLNDDQYQYMLQTFLKERFHLKAHWETKELSVLALVVAKGGPRLHVAKPGDTYPDGLKGPDGKPGHAGMMMWGSDHLTAQGIPVSSLISPLTLQLGHIVQDKTGLTGTYDIDLHWTPDSPSGNPDSAPSLVTAIQEQLGLKFQSEKSSVRVVQIDQVEQPTEN